MSAFARRDPGDRYRKRVGIRLSPYGVFNGTGAFADVEAQYLALKLSGLGLLYVHLPEHCAMGAPPLAKHGLDPSGWRKDCDILRLRC